MRERQRQSERDRDRARERERARMRGYQIKRGHKKMTEKSNTKLSPSVSSRQSI